MAASLDIFPEEEYISEAERQFNPQDVNAVPVAKTDFAVKSQW
jgi:hypothetical protein